MVKQITTTSLLFFVLVVSTAFTVPKIRAHTNDYASVIPSPVEQKLNHVLARVKTDTGIEMGILTINSLEGLTIEEASIKVTDKWQLGTAKEDKGILLLFAVKDRKLRIEVGQGLEGDLTDLRSKRIIDHTIVPFLKEGNWGDAVLVGAYKILQTADPTTNMKQYFDSLPSPPRVRRRRGRGDSSLGQILIYLLVFFLVWAFGGFGPPGRGGRYYGGFGGYGGGGGFGGGSSGGFGGGGGFSGGGASGGW